MPSELFSDYFLNEGIQATDGWRDTADSPGRFKTFVDAIQSIFAQTATFVDPNEATTEQELIVPILNALGWNDHLPQRSSTGKDNIPDLLLYLDSDAKERAQSSVDPRDAYRNATVVQENKRQGVRLDERDQSERGGTSSPHRQILRYLTNAEIESDGAIRWGILTNGDVWRLYDYRTRPRETSYYEFDLASTVKNPTTTDGQDELRMFWLIFGRDSYARRHGATRSFLEACQHEAKTFEERVAQDISAVVFETVFPDLIAALSSASEKHPSEVREPALILLYRLLFLLFAEDRGLLPVNHHAYQTYSMRRFFRDHGPSDSPAFKFGSTLSNDLATGYGHFKELCRLVDKGDGAVGVPAYNGNLFAPDAAPLLSEVRLVDSDFVPIVQALSHTLVGGKYRYVNYRDMSVQQLGSIYERLLEREPVLDNSGRVQIVLHKFARKDSGSFYTPQDLVDLVVDQTLSPLVEDRVRTFEEKAKELEQDSRNVSEKLGDLMEVDPAAAILNLKVLDPAMGSGHFLVSAVDFLADYIADVIDYSAGVPEWAGGNYESPVVNQVAEVRATISNQAVKHGWRLEESQLNDLDIIRRLVLKRCIYGVDKNPLTVELAKVSLWLHSFTVGAPLSFLDHHLRCGDSLVGIRTNHATKELYRLGGLFAQSAVATAEKAATAIDRLEELPDAVIDDVQQSRELLEKAERNTSDLRGMLDFVCALDWITAGFTKRQRADFEAPIVDALEQGTNGAEKLILGEGLQLPRGESRREKRIYELFDERRQQIRQVAYSENFLHWETSFPGVWNNLQGDELKGGFDAVIGNPPWERFKIQEKEWLETRDSRLAKISRAADRWNELENLRRKGSTLADDLDQAKQRATHQSQWVRNSKMYPLLGTGDMNLYSLFVERAHSLVKPMGMVGLLTPSGIYGDGTAAKFFRRISTSRRIQSLFDFENRRTFFSDVHASFKFCVLSFGGLERNFDKVSCGFFLHSVDQLQDPTRVFTIDADEFRTANPNTGTAAIFKTTKDAEITLAIQKRHPLLVDKTHLPERFAWPIRHGTMFHSGNDSHRFRSANDLDSAGYYRIEGSRWKRGDNLMLPLYEGKMVQGFNHRAASAFNRSDIVYRPGQREYSDLEQLASPDFTTEPRFWVEAESSDELINNDWFIAFKDVTASTNARTMIAAVLPKVASTGTLRLLLESGPEFNASTAALIVANLNCFALDYVARQKVHGTHLTWYTVQQLPVIALADYGTDIGGKPVTDLVADHVLKLTYNSHDMQAFALELGHTGEPFPWIEDDRRHVRARLDALYFLLYGLSRDDASYILSTFPGIQRDDEKQFGRFLTRDLIMGYMNALEAGDTDSVIEP